MNFKTTILLLVALAVVGGIFFYSESGPKPTAEDQNQNTDQTTAAQGKKLLGITIDQVTGVTITDADGNRTVLTKDGATWKLTEPVKSAAVDWQANGLIQTLCDLRSQGTPAGTPSDSGLDKPRFAVDLSTSDGKTVHVAIGNKTGVGDVMYAQADSGDVNLIDSSLAKTLKTAADDLRDKHLLTTPSTDIRQVRITTPSKTLEMVKIDNAWKITQPAEISGDSDAISSLISSITGIEASEFVKGDSDELMLARFDHPTMQVWISSDPPATQPSTQPSGGQTLTIGSPDSFARDHFFAQTSDGLTAKIDKSALDGLQKTALDLRDKNTVLIPPSDVIRVSMLKETFPTAPATPSTEPLENELKPIASQLVTMLRRPKPAAQPFGPVSKSSTAPSAEPIQSVWMFSTDAKSPVDDSKVDALLQKFNPFHADKYLEKPPVEPWQNRYLVTVQATSASYDIQFFRPAAGLTPYAIYNGLTFELPSATLDALDADFHKAP